MATVHRAIERGIEGFERVVALKRLLPHLAEDEGFVRAFVREAKLASLLQHGNIVQLYELGRVGPSYFISMEYIPGRDLRVILRQARRVCGPPPVDIALALLTELLDALDYAHGQCGSDGKPLGLVHRDISPSNLIVSHTGHLKVIDFGIAKATLGHLMTHTGRIKGKLSYMAPEALAGRTLDGRSDLFSASVIAHELLTASPLFAAKDDFQTIDRLQNMQPPPPSTRNPTCPSELDEIVLRGLAKDPAKRWRSAAEMRAAMAELAIDHHRLATNREVCDWVEEAFEMPLPSRLRLPLSPSPALPTGEHRRIAAEVADDEVMDLVWGVTGPRSPMAIVLDDVPDVSSRFSRVEQAAVDAFDPLDPMIQPRMPDAQLAASMALGGEDEPTNAVVRPTLDGLARGEVAEASDPRVTYRTPRSQPISLMSAAAVAELTPRGGLVSTTGRATANGGQTARPSAWAVGTSPTKQQISNELEQALAGARRAEPGPPASTTLSGMAAERPSLLPLLVASVAVAAAGAAIAWIISSDSGEPAQVASAGTPVPPPAHVQPLSQGQGAIVPLDEPRSPPPEARKVAAEPEPEPERPADARKRKPRGKREEVAPRVRDRVEPAARDEVTAADEKLADVAPREERAPDEPARAEPEESRQTTTTAKKSGVDAELQPLPVQVPTPATGRAVARRRGDGPIIVPPNRTRRESGTVPPIRFPRWEEAPSIITAKLCIDTRGKVTAVTVMSRVSDQARTTIERALARWQYRPIVEGAEKIAACFATTFRVQVLK